MPSASTKNAREVATCSAASRSSESRVVLNAEVAADAEVSKAAPVEVFRTDYKPLPYLVSETKLNFDIHSKTTSVIAELKIVLNDKGDGVPSDFELDGDEESVKLLSVKLNGEVLEKDKDFVLAPGKLTLKSHLFAGLKSTSDSAVLETVVDIVPEDNTQLSGMYKSGGMYCSQCEAMGFRRITYYPDRPDNMSSFTSVRIEADEGECPVLLSNGNLIR